MQKIGITGGIGSGKTTVCNIFKMLGIPVFNADYQAKLLLQNNQVKQQLNSWFGNLIFTNNQVDKKKMAQLIFNNPNAISKVNGLIHPLVAQQFEQWVLLNKQKPIVIKESALIFENNLQASLNVVILVTAPVQLRVARVMERDNMLQQQVIDRINNQMPDDEKQKLANYKIINDNNTLLIPQVLAIISQILK